MNTFYNWSKDEIMITERMKDIQRESEQVHLLHEAGIANAGERMANAFGNILVKLGEHLRQKHTHSHQTYQTIGGKYAV